MIAASLQSGSNGNCYVLASGGAGLFVDAGISWASARVRLEALGLETLKFRALLLTHEHSDHALCAATFHKACQVPIHLTLKTAEVLRGSTLKKVHRDHVRPFRPGQVIEIPPFRVETYRIAHDAVDPVCYVVDDGAARVGVITDLGRASRAVQQVLASLDAVFIESNFDEGLLLANARYPHLLKERIRSHRGHLENGQSAALVKKHAGVRLRHVVLSHLSADNNHPDLALAAHQAQWDGELPLFPRPDILVAPRNRPSPRIEI